jgi:tripartite-type tricarboxylate transporter receptor subunit TctC
MMARLFRIAAAGILAAGAAAAVQAEPAWPGKTITLIVPYTAGGSTDTIGRTLAELLNRSTGASVILENKPGAGGSVGTDLVARARPDGATLLLAATSPVTIFPNLVKTSYDPMKDLTPIASVAVDPVGIFATKKLPQVKDFAGMVDYAKKHPGALTFGVPALGSVAHIGMADLLRQVDINMLQVPYRGGSQAITDGLGGVVDLLVVNTDVALPHVASGALRPLAVMAPRKLEAWPDVPTMAELNLPKIRYFSNYAMFAPAHLPPAVMRAIQAELSKAMADPRYAEMLKKTAMEPGTGVGEDFAQQVRSDYENNRRIIQENNIKAE